MTSDDSRGPDGLWRKGHSGHPATLFKTGDPANPRTARKRAREAAGKPPSARQALAREELRAELVALDVLERFLSPARQNTAPRLPRLPDDAKNARREARRIAARSMTRALRALQRIARDPSEPALVRLEVARLLLERGSLLPMGTAGGAGNGADGKPKKEPKVIVVHSPIPRRPWQDPKPATEKDVATGAPGGPRETAIASAPASMEATPPACEETPPATRRKSPWEREVERAAQLREAAARQVRETEPRPARPRQTTTENG